MTADVLRVENLSKDWGRRQVLRGVSFSVGPKTLVGIVGENGAGKTTLLRILAGLLPPTRGRVRLTGRLGYCPQDVNLNESLTVRQHLAFLAAAYKLPETSFAESLVDRLDYRRYLDTPVAKLSGGTKQKLNLTLSLMHRPAVLLLDEPYQGFDWETYLRFWDLTAELQDAGSSIVVISHLIFDQKRFDVIYHLSQGDLRPMPGLREVRAP